MLDELLNNGYFISILSNSDYKKIISGLQKQIKGKSEYENYAMVEYLPRNKEFYVVCDDVTSNEAGTQWYFEIALIYKGIPLILTDNDSD